MTPPISNDWTTDPEYIELLNYLIERTKNVESPMFSCRTTMAKEFKAKSGAVQTVHCLADRINRIRTWIHDFEHIDAETKVKVLFVLSDSVHPKFFNHLKKDAVIEVDEKRRITYYKANDGSLELRGDHSMSAKKKTEWIERKKNRNLVKDDSFERFNKEFGSELDSDDEYDHLDKIEMGEDHGRKRENSFPIASTSEKRRNTGTTGFSSSNWTGSFSNNSMSPNELDDYEPFRGSIQEDLEEIIKYEDIQQVRKPLQAHDEHNQIEEIPIKVELEDPIEIKPETSHNPKIKFFEAMQSLILFLDTPSLSDLQSKIHQKILKIEGSEEMMPNNEIVLIIELLIARMANHSVVNFSKNLESVKLPYFLCYLKAAILNSKMSGVEGLMKNITKLIEDSQNKRISMEKVETAFRETLSIDSL